jgi:hypothetical protein
VCPSLIDGFWLPLYCMSFFDWRLLITIVLCVLLWFTASDYHCIVLIRSRQSKKDIQYNGNQKPSIKEGHTIQWSNETRTKTNNDLQNTTQKTKDWATWSHHRGNCTVATMTWLTVTEYLYLKLPRICSFSPNQFPVLSPFMTYHRVLKYRINWERYILHMQVLLEFCYILYIFIITYL